MKSTQVKTFIKVLGDHIDSIKIILDDKMIADSNSPCLATLSNFALARKEDVDVHYCSHCLQPFIIRPHL